VSFAGVRQSPEPHRDIVERFAPRHWRKFAIAFPSGSLERTAEPQRVIAPGSIIGDRALAAQNSLRDGMLGISNNPADLSIDYRRRNSAGIVAIARTGRFDRQ
jgi:hypothetical protein